MNRLLLPVDGPPIASEQDALDIIGEAMGQGAELVVIPVMRLSPEFFRLASSVAGAMLQKFTNYQLRRHRRRRLGLYKPLRPVRRLRPRIQPPWSDPLRQH